FPPARGIVELRHLVQAELLIVIGANPLGRVDRPLLERRVDLAARDLLRHDAELAEDTTTETADAEFQPVEVRDSLDLAAEPTAHLAARIANRKRVDIELLIELIHQLDATVMVFPSVLHPRVRPEW